MTTNNISDQLRSTNVRDVQAVVLDTIKEAMRVEGITSLSDGAALKWAATQYARILREKNNESAAAV